MSYLYPQENNRIQNCELRFGRLTFMYKECVHIEISKTVSIRNFSCAHVFISLALSSIIYSELLEKRIKEKREKWKKKKKRIFFSSSFEIIVFLKEWFRRDTCGFSFAGGTIQDSWYYEAVFNYAEAGVLEIVPIAFDSVIKSGRSADCGYPGGGLGRLSILLQSGRAAGGCSLKWLFSDPIRWLVALIHGQPKI